MGNAQGSLFYSYVLRKANFSEAVKGCEARNGSLVMWKDALIQVRADGGRGGGGGSLSKNGSMQRAQDLEPPVCSTVQTYLTASGTRRSHVRAWQY